MWPCQEFHHQEDVWRPKLGLPLGDERHPGAQRGAVTNATQVHLNTDGRVANTFAVQRTNEGVCVASGILIGTPVCRLCGRYMGILGRPIGTTVPAVTVAPTTLVGSLIRSSNLPHSLQRGVHTSIRYVPSYEHTALYLGELHVSSFRHIRGKQRCWFIYFWDGPSVPTVDWGHRNGSLGPLNVSITAMTWHLTWHIHMLNIRTETEIKY